MEGGSTSATKEADPTAASSSEPGGESLLSESLQKPDTPRELASDPCPPVDRGEILRALEIVERDSAAIAESYASLFSSLRLALSEVTSTSVENMQCFNDVVGRLQESALDAATKGSRYINSCLRFPPRAAFCPCCCRLNEEMKGLESLAMQLKFLKKNVDSLDLAVSRILRLP